MQDYLFNKNVNFDNYNRKTLESYTKKQLIQILKWNEFNLKKFNKKINLNKYNFNYNFLLKCCSKEYIINIHEQIFNEYSKYFKLYQESLLKDNLTIGNFVKRIGLIDFIILKYFNKI